jgi:hypothetical protein
MFLIYPYICNLGIIFMSLDHIIQTILDHFNSDGTYYPVSFTGLIDLPTEALLSSGIDISSLSDGELDYIIHHIEQLHVMVSSNTDFGPGVGTDPGNNGGESGGYKKPTSGWEWCT